MAYATLQDFYDRLKPEAITNFERRIAAVSPAEDRFLAPGHGLQSGYAVRFVAGRTTTGVEGALPAPLSAFTTYYVLVASGDLFAVSATPGGSAIDLTTVGTGLLSFVVDMEASVVRELTRQEARIDACLKARGVVLPLVGTFPDLADLAIDLAVFKILLARGYQTNREINPDQDYKVLWEAAEERLSDLCSEDGKLPPGIPVDTTFQSPSEAWDPNARGWLDTRYYPDGGI